MEFEPCDIAAVVRIKPKRFGDARGYFVETFRQDLFDRHIGRQIFVQDNQSLSALEDLALM